MRHLIHQINDKTTPFNIYILTFVSIWVFVKLLALRVRVCRKSGKNDQKWRLFICVGCNNTFITVCLCLKELLSSRLIYITFIFLLLLVVEIVCLFQ